MIRKGQVGSLFNVTGARETNALQRIAVENSRLKIPLIFGMDVIHGFRTTFPIPLGLAATWEPEIVEKAARVAASEASSAGVRWAFSPMVDIARDARWGRISEGAGEDPYLGAAMARAYVRGYQGPRLDATDSIVACAKHYVGYGAAEGGRLQLDGNFRTHAAAIYLPPFAPPKRRSGHVHVRIQRFECDSDVGKSIHAEASIAKGMGLPGICGK
jgi:beta-glucosidase